MPTTYTIKAKPKDQTQVGWYLEISRWLDDQATAPIVTRLTDWIEDDGVFTATADLVDGRYGLAANLFGPGREVEIDMSPRPPIFQPAQSNWPFKAKLPATTSQGFRIRFFRVGGGQ